jgi:hypothetical protein
LPPSAPPQTSATSLNLAYEGLTLPGTDDHRLVAYFPANDATAEALAVLNSLLSRG